MDLSPSILLHWWQRLTHGVGRSSASGVAVVGGCGQPVSGLEQRSCRRKHGSTLVGMAMATLVNDVTFLKVSSRALSCSSSSVLGESIDPVSFGSDDSDTLLYAS